ncbi:MAG: hypothetical protein GY827_03700 [Cytophagales bacterium]|nr:hypothetical protein [Cytophagales bacterium]
MKKILISLSLWLGVSLLWAQEAEYSKASFQNRIASSGIKSGVAIGYAYGKDGRKKPAGYKEFMEMFDKKGLLRQYIVYENNQIKERWSFKYNKQKLKSAALCYNGQEELIEKYTNKYKNGLIISQEGARNGVPYKITYKYKKKKLIEEKKIENGVEKYTLTFSYNTQGEQTQKLYKNQKYAVRTDFVYNDQNQMISEKLYVDDTLKQYTNYSYNEKGEKYKETKYNTNNEPQTEYTYFYTPGGIVRKIALYDFNLGYEEYSWVYTFDGNGNIDKMYTYSAKYNLKVNNQDKPVYVREHVYRYFKKKKTKKK